MAEHAVLLERIRAHLVRLSRPVASMLLPGLTRRRILDNGGDLPLRLPESVIGLYSWRDGVDPASKAILDDLYFFPWRYFMSLEEAKSSYASIVCFPETGWQPTWFPLFCSGGGDFHAIECKPTDPIDGPVIDYFRGDPEHSVVYSSLISMLRTIDACYAEGAFTVTEDGSLEKDDALEARLARQYNPGVEFWMRGS